MSTTRGSSDEALPKRMRLGTRSCAECRRRKIRCVFSEDSSACEGCTLHDTPCEAQQPKRSEKRRHEHAENTALRKRVDEMEAMIRQIYGAVKFNADPPSLGGAQTSTHELNHLGHSIALNQNPPTPGTDVSLTSPKDHLNPPLSDTLTILDTSGHPDALSEFGNTPLLKLFKEALLLCKGDGKSVETPKLQHQRSIQSLINAILPMVPPKYVLKRILETTRRCWDIWPVCFHGSEPLHDMTIENMLDFILMSFSSDDPAVAAKALLWVGLSVFELPLSFSKHYPELSKPDALVDTFLHHARRLLAVTTECGETIDCIEALMLEIKLNVDLGRPRKAWLSARQAINATLLLGLDHMNSDDNRRGQNIWRMVLHFERETCLILGLPSSISNFNKSLLPKPGGLLPLDRLRHEMMILAGSVSDRNQATIEESYSKTIELDHDLENIKKIMPDDFWDAEPPPGLSFGELYFRQTTKIRFFILGKLIHLPYMLKSTKERKFLLSRTACLDASRELIIAYQNLQKGADPELAPCGLMDFETFSAGTVMAIDLLQEASRRHANSSQSIQDQTLLVQLVGSLHQASTLMECTVAGQAAEVLDILVSVIRGDVRQDTVDEGCDVTIPFFGRLRVRVPDSIRNDTGDSSSTTPGSGSQSLPTPLPVVELGTTLLDHNMFSNFDMDAELTADWSTSFDAGNYDWVTVFQQDQMMNAL